MAAVRDAPLENQVVRDDVNTKDLIFGTHNSVGLI
jgi:hypothetical protein